MIFRMGMFDTIYLKNPIACKTCGADILDFQTKEFDNCLNHYRIGSVLSGTRILSGVIKDEAYCQGCSDAKRDAWMDVYLVVWHTILAGVETEECKAEARLTSVDRLDLVQWIEEAQKKEEQWQRRFFDLRNELRGWHEYVEDQKKTARAGNRRQKNLEETWLILGAFGGNNHRAGPDWKNIRTTRSQEKRRTSGLVLIRRLEDEVPPIWGRRRR